MNQELITYIVLGWYERLRGIKKPYLTDKEEYVLANFTNNKSLEESLDKIISCSKGNLIVLLPPSTLPNTKSKEVLKKISMIDQSSWGWFQFDERKNNFIQNLKKISSSIRSIPNIEQCIYFTKRLYFSVGGLGDIGVNPFAELAKRFYLRLDPQKPLPSLTIRAKSLLN